MADYPAEFEELWEAGTERLTIRPIRPGDAAAHDAFFHRLSPEDIRHRFFVAVRELSPAQLDRLTRPDYEREMALIAVRETTSETVGVARLAREEDDPRTSEFAVVLQQNVRGRGLATHLMRRLLEWAACRSVQEVIGEILADNREMLALARRLGFRLQHSVVDPGVIEARLSLLGRSLRDVAGLPDTPGAEHDRHDTQHDQPRHDLVPGHSRNLPGTTSPA
jgi:acetyltransferase